MSITRDAVSWPTVETFLMGRLAQIQLDLETASAAAVPRLQGACAELRLLLQEADPPKPTPSGPLTY